MLRRKLDASSTWGPGRCRWESDHVPDALEPVKREMEPKGFDCATLRYWRSRIPVIKHFRKDVISPSDLELNEEALDLPTS